MRLLNLPLPLFIAVAGQEIIPASVDGPGWVVAALTGVFVVLWFLNAIGRLPGGGNGDRRAGGFYESDRAHLCEVHRNVTREDARKAGWPMVWAPADEIREIRELVRELAALKAIWIADREEWHRERANLEARITHLEDVIRRQEYALKARGSVGDD